MTGDTPDPTGEHPLARFAAEQQRVPCTAMSEDVVRTAALMRHQLGRLIEMAVLGDALPSDYRQLADEIEYSSREMAEALREAADTLAGEASD